MLDPRLVSLAAESTLAAARSHKQAAAMHRRHAAKLYEQLENLKRVARAQGVDLVIEGDDHIDA